ncbi:MAG: hypothetical protein P8H03_09355 [Emcibacteraceae bacterium]|nr:hypothetical protein [Emcibacteraceae bacterium]
MTENTENNKDEELNEENEEAELPETEVEEEVTPLSVAEDEINDLRDQLLRAVAETQNVRRRA